MTFIVKYLDPKGTQGTMTLTAESESFARAIFFDVYSIRGYKLLNIYKA